MDLLDDFGSVGFLLPALRGEYGQGIANVHGDAGHSLGVLGVCDGSMACESANDGVLDVITKRLASFCRVRTGRLAACPEDPEETEIRRRRLLL